MPPLVTFLLKWTAAGVAAGWLFLAALLASDMGGIGERVAQSSSWATAIVILALSFAVTFAQIMVLAAVLLSSDFGGTGPVNARLARWKAGHSAELGGGRTRIGR